MAIQTAEKRSMPPASITMLLPHTIRQPLIITLRRHIITILVSMTRQKSTLRRLTNTASKPISIRRLPTSIRTNRSCCLRPALNDQRPRNLRGAFLLIRGQRFERSYSSSSSRAFQMRVPSSLTRIS